jgi:large subunit ribosomal protein L21
MYMYAMIEIGGQQHRVSPGNTIKVQKIAGDAKEVSFDKVLLVSRDDDTVSIGNPFVLNAVVTADVQGDIKAAKVIVYKQKPRKGYRKLNGHKQNYTVLKIKDIVVGG